MGDLSNDFSRWEFKCKCGGCDFDTVDAELLDALQQLRDYYNARVTITSGCRCPQHNQRVPGAHANSMHLYARAADFKVEGVRPAEVQAYLLMKYPDRFGIGSYDNRTHLDTRRQPARWNG